LKRHLIIYPSHSCLFKRQWSHSSHFLVTLRLLSFYWNAVAVIEITCWSGFFALLVNDHGVITASHRQKGCDRPPMVNQYGPPMQVSRCSIIGVSVHSFVTQLLWIRVPCFNSPVTVGHRWVGGSRCRLWIGVTCFHSPVTVGQRWVRRSRC
jgi:hypothetical protein